MGIEQRFVKASELLQSKAFLSELQMVDNDSDCQKLFRKYGVELSIDDIQKMVEESQKALANPELAEDQLEEVTGGILITASAFACFTVGSAMIGFLTNYGYRTVKDMAKNKRRR